MAIDKKIQTFIVLSGNGFQDHTLILVCYGIAKIYPHCSSLYLKKRWKPIAHIF